MAMSEREIIEEEMWELARVANENSSMELAGDFLVIRSLMLISKQLEDLSKEVTWLSQRP